MKNRKIKEYKKKLDTIMTGLNIAENEPLEQRLEKLVGVIRMLQNLADVVGARKYLGAELQGIDQLLTEEMKKRTGIYKTELYMRKCADSKKVYNEIHDNILYKLQTEMMFNACVFAKRSCFFAAIAAIVACISVILTVCLN